jgi:putative MATE family efflux protein
VSRVVGSSLTQGSIAAPVLKLSATFALGSFLNMIGFVVDRKLVGLAGTHALAALGSAHAALMIIVTFALGLSIGALSGVARHMGAGEPGQAARFAINGVYVGLAFGLAMLGLSFIAPAPVLAFMGADPDVSGPAADYLAVTMAGMVFHAPLLMLAFSLQGAGLARLALLLSAIPALLNAALDWPFIFTFGLGVAGAAWAGVVAHVVGLVLALVLLFRSPLKPEPGGLRFDAARVKRIVQIGVPGSLEHMVRTVAGFALVALITRFGAEVVSGYTSGQVILMLLVTPGVAIGQATATLVGQNLGARAPRRAWDTVKIATGLYVGLVAVAGLLVYLGADHLIGSFDPHPEVMAQGALMLRTGVLCFPFLAVAMVVSRAFAGAGRTVPMMVVAAIAHLGVQIPTVVLLSRALGPIGAYIGMSVAFTVHGALSGAMFLRRFGAWRRNEIAPTT